MKTLFAITALPGNKMIHVSLNKFKSRKLAEKRLIELTEKGIITGIPVEIVEYNPKYDKINC